MGYLIAHLHIAYGNVVRQQGPCPYWTPRKGTSPLDPSGRSVAVPTARPAPYQWAGIPGPLPVGRRGGAVAIYHLHVKVLSRSKGHNAIKASAYRAGLSLQNIDGRVIDYSNRSDVVPLPIQGDASCMPGWAFDRQTLWQSIEQAEKRKDARLAREVEFALPIEFTRQEKMIAIQKMVWHIIEKFNVPVDAVLHDKDGNPHCHIMIPLRSITKDGWGGRLREMDSKDFVLDMRKTWEVIANNTLERYGTNIDHRSYEERGISKVPQMHLGKRLYTLIKAFLDNKPYFVIGKKRILFQTEQSPEGPQTPEEPQKKQPQNKPRDINQIIEQNKPTSHNAKKDRNRGGLSW
jgi:hypothetical protein